MASKTQGLLDQCPGGKPELKQPPVTHECFFLFLG